MSDEGDRPLAEALVSAGLEPLDPRLAAYAAGTLSAPDREALLKEAKDDADLAATLERLAPLDDVTRHRFRAEALAALPAPRRRFARAGVALAAVAAAAAAAFLLLTQGPEVEIVRAWDDAPHQSASRRLALIVRSRDGRAPSVWADHGGRLVEAHVEWTREGEDFRVEAPAHAFTAGWFGRTTVVVAPQGASEREAREEGALLAIEVDLPTYALRDVQYRGSDPMRGAPPAEDATRVELTLRPAVTVASGVTACAFVRGPGGVAASEAGCRRFDDGLVQLAVPIAEARRGADRTLFFAVGPPDAELEAADLGPDGPPPGWRLVDVPVP